MSVLAVVAVVLLLFGVAYWQFPQATRRWFDRIATVRRVVWSFLLLAFAFVALTAGTVGYALVGAVILGYALLYVAFEEPFEPVRDLLGI